MQQKAQYSGLIALNKPVQMSSHDLVDCVRRILKFKKIGHAGTLDPTAEGLMLLGLGPATKLLNYLSLDDKSYELSMKFCYETSTDDADKKASRRTNEEFLTGQKQFLEQNLAYNSQGFESFPVLDSFRSQVEADPSVLKDPAFVNALFTKLKSFSYYQVPPAVSAVHCDGKRSYDLAFKGMEVKLTPRKTNVYSCKFLGFDEVEDDCIAAWKISLHVSKGTYVRSFVRDLGRALSYPAHVTKLTRCASGSISSAEALNLEDFAYAPHVEELYINPLKLLDLPFVCLEQDSELQWLLQGRDFSLEHIKFLKYKGDELQELDSLEYKRCIDEAAYALIVYRDKLFAVGQFLAEQKSLHPCKVFMEGIEIGKDSNKDFVSKLQGIASSWKLYDLKASKSYPLLKPDISKAVCCMGVFDGLHKGHQYLIEAMKKDAQSLSLPSVLISFDKDPDELAELVGDQRCIIGKSWSKNAKLQSNEERRSALKNMGTDYYLEIPFTKELASMPYEDFLNKLKDQFFSIASMHLGDNFSFGEGLKGNIDTVGRWLNQAGAQLHAYPLLCLDGEVVSSTRIRELLHNGDPDRAAKLLGRPYSLEGVVVQGRQEGRSFGIPTANIEELKGVLVPKEAVYAGYLDLYDKKKSQRICYPAAISVGEAPSFEGKKRAHIEAFLIGFKGNIYKRKVRLSFVTKLRDMRKFDSLEELISTVEHNIRQVKEIVGDKAWTID